MAQGECTRRIYVCSTSANNEIPAVGKGLVGESRCPENSSESRDVGSDDPFDALLFRFSCFDLAANS